MRRWHKKKVRESQFKIEERRKNMKRFLIVLSAAGMLFLWAIPVLSKQVGEIREDKQELREDKQELREDVQELKEDKKAGASKEEIKQDIREINQDKREIRNDLSKPPIGIDRSKEVIKVRMGFVH